MHISSYFNYDVNILANLYNKNETFPIITAAN